MGFVVRKPVRFALEVFLVLFALVAVMTLAGCQSNAPKIDKGASGCSSLMSQFDTTTEYQAALKTARSFHASADVQVPLDQAYAAFVKLNTDEDNDGSSTTISKDLSVIMEIWKSVRTTCKAHGVDVPTFG